MSTTEKKKLDHGMTRKLLVTMPDGSVWSLPVVVIIENRLQYYRGRGTATDADLSPDDATICDWAANNMNWSDVEVHTVLHTPPKSPDYHKGWINGPKRIQRA